eukprot:364577-Chlamydomonas_euryale.AAC.30
MSGQGQCSRPPESTADQEHRLNLQLACMHVQLEAPAGECMHAHAKAAADAHGLSCQRVNGHGVKLNNGRALLPHSRLRNAAGRPAAARTSATSATTPRAGAIDQLQLLQVQAGQQPRACQRFGTLRGLR